MHLDVAGIVLSGIGVLLGALFGYFSGQMRGEARGKEEIVQKVKALVVRGKIDFDLEELLRGKTLNNDVT